MPLDPERVAEVRAWLAKAASDERAAVHELQANPPLTGDICFHAQQMAEKSLKAFLIWHDVPFRKTHDISEIGRQCLSIEPSLAKAISEAEDLTVFAWLFRYPGEAEDPPLADARRYLEAGQRLNQAIQSGLPAECRP